MLEIIDLHANVEGKPLLKGVNLSIRKAEVHAVMGPNGAGKSTLARILVGDPAYEVTAGRILFEGVDIAELKADARAHLGLFLSFQYPVELPGISNEQFLLAACNAKRRG